MSDKPFLVIPLDSYRKIMAYVANCETEITGFFDVEWNDEKGAFLVTKVYDLLKQDASGAHVEVDEEKISEFNLELIKQGAEQLPRGWWHSHSDMDTFLSGTDEQTVEYLKNDSFIVAIVANKAGKMMATVQLFRPFAFAIEDIPLRVEYADDKLNQSVKKEIEKQVNQQSWQQSWNQGQVWDWSKKSKKNKKKKGQKVNFLPAEQEKAINRIAELGLSREWSGEYHDFIYVDELTGDTWLDSGQVMTQDAYEESQKLFKKMYE